MKPSPTPIPSIEPTPESVSRAYETLKANLEVVRRRTGRPLTLADKLLLGHLDAPNTGDLVPGKSYLALRPDRVVLQDVLGQTAMLQFMQTGRARVAIPSTIHCDHPDPGAKSTGFTTCWRRSRRTARSTTFCAPRRHEVRRRTLGTRRGHHSTRWSSRPTRFLGQLILGTDSHTAQRRWPRVMRRGRRRSGRGRGCMAGLAVGGALPGRHLAVVC